MKKEFFSKLKENMKAAKNILAFCTKHRAELLPVDKGYMVFVAHELTQEAEAELRGLIPDSESAEIKFEVAPKLQTKMNVENLIRRAQPKDGKVLPDLDHRSITIELEGVADGDPVWGEMSEVLKRDGFFDSWKFVIEGQEVSVLPKMSEELAKNRNQRATGISETDITDLKISLGNAQTIDDILKAIGG
jgi:hypothetical protein